jgi:hypothetical protein
MILIQFHKSQHFRNAFILTMGVSTVETNRDRDRDCPSC